MQDNLDSRPTKSEARRAYFLSQAPELQRRTEEGFAHYCEKEVVAQQLLHQQGEDEKAAAAVVMLRVPRTPDGCTVDEEENDVGVLIGPPRVLHVMMALYAQALEQRGSLLGTFRTDGDFGPEVEGAAG